MSCMQRTPRLLAALALLAGLVSCAAPHGPASPRQGTPRSAPATPLWVGYRTGFGSSHSGPLVELPLPAGLYARYELDPDWSVGLGIDLFEGELEGEARALGLDPASAEADEAITDLTEITLWAERMLWREGDHQVFGKLGAGVGRVHSDGARGALAGGGTFDLQVEGRSENLGLVGLGYRYAVSERWAFEVVGQYEAHDADWRIVDRDSSASAPVGDYRLLTFLLGFAYHF